MKKTEGPNPNLGRIEKKEMLVGSLAYKGIATPDVFTAHILTEKTFNKLYIEVLKELRNIPWVNKELAIEKLLKEKYLALGLQPPVVMAEPFFRYENFTTMPFIGKTFNGVITASGKTAHGMLSFLDMGYESGLLNFIAVATVQETDTLRDGQVVEINSVDPEKVTVKIVAEKPKSK